MSGVHVQRDLSQPTFIERRELARSDNAPVLPKPMSKAVTLPAIAFASAGLWYATVRVAESLLSYLS